MRDFAKANAIHSLRLSAELIRVIAALQRAGIPAVPFKGPALAQRLYGNIAAREFVDLDVFVPLSELARARCILADIGYEADAPVARLESSQFLKSECEYILQDRNGNVIELHWDIAPRLHTYDLDLSQIWQRIETAKLCGSSVPAFDDADLMLLLLLHGAKHGWSRLKWLCDIARLIEVTHIDYELLLSEAEERGYRRAAIIALGLAAYLLKARIPERVAALYNSDRIASSLTELVILRTARGGPLSERESLHFRMLSRERHADKLRVLGRTLFFPNQADYEHRGHRQSFGYIARPIRLLTKRLLATN